MPSRCSISSVIHFERFDEVNLLGPRRARVLASAHYVTEPRADRGPQAGSPLGVVDATGSFFIFHFSFFICWKTAIQIKSAVRTARVPRVRMRACFLQLRTTEPRRAQGRESD